MNAGFQKPALVAYLALCVYLLAQPSPTRLADRAEVLDKQLAAQGPSLNSALATALDMPAAKVEIYLSFPDSKPSDLVFAKLLDKCGAKAENKTPADTVVNAGMPAREAIAYFDEVEKLVTQTLARNDKVEVVVNPTRISNVPALVHSLRSQPD